MKIYSRLGRTELNVPAYGFGGIPVGRDHLSDREGADLIRRAVDEGIVLIDTFCNYGRSETRIGMGIEGRRDDVVLVTKSRGAYEPDDFSEMIENSLRTMKTDRIDVLLLKNVDNENSRSKVESNVEVLHRLQRQGKVRFTGLSSHNPQYCCDALRTGLLDIAEVPYNYANRQFEDALDLATELDIGILAMKPLGGGRLFGDAEKGSPETLNTLVDALSFALSHPCGPVLIPGIGTHDELNRYLEAIPKLKYLDQQRCEELTAKAMEFGDDFCRTCGYCRSVCPADVPIDEILPLLDRMKHVQTDNTYKKILKDKFQQVAAGSNKCEVCGKCVQECPYNLPIPDRIKEAYETLGA